MNRYLLLDMPSFLAVLGISFLVGVLIGWGLAIWTMGLRGVW